ncbi:MAG: murein biosynthesis integral membrane protein MurJ [Bacillota bacterium]|nr:murein biosynthesis integral membrane protein MurJ [Thermoanaerobacteraceae bacterium]
MSTGRIVARATVLILALSLLSRLLGLGREMAIAYGFGTTGTADAFFVAYTIPYVFYGVVGVALTTVIVPVFADYAAAGRREEAWRVLSLVINVSFAVMAVLALLGAAGSPFIARTLGAGFPPETMELAADLTAVMMPAIIFMTIAGIFAGILNANQVFGPPALGPATMNVMIIAGALVGAGWWGVYGLAAGAVAGATAFALVQLPALRYVGFRYSLSFDLRHPEVRRVVALMLPVILASGIMQLYTLIDWRLASGLAEGSIAALNYANKLMNLPQGLFVTAVTTAIFPTLSRLIAEERRADMAAALQRAVKVVLLLGIPGAVGLILLREPIVTLLFERGAFDARATGMTASALLFYAVGLAGLCLNLPLTRGFFAMKDTRTPLLIAGFTVVVKLALSLMLVRVLQHAGLALATSLTVLLNMFILSLLLRRRLPELFDRAFFRFVAGTAAAAAVMGVGVFMLDAFLAARLAAGSLALMVRVGLDIAAGALLFGAAGLVLRLDELGYILHTLFGLFHRRAGTVLK